MAKRLRDTAMWDKKWFRELSPSMKCFVDYILSKCDAAGIWDVDFPAASFNINEKIYEEKIPDIIISSLNIIKLNENRWFISEYIPFQYGEKYKESKVWPSIKRILDRYCTDTVSIRYLYGMDTVNIKEKEKDKEKEEEKEEEKNVEYRPISEHLMSRILETRQQKITEHTLNQWDKHVHRMVEIDKRTLSDIKTMIDECHDMPASSTGFTWRDNIRSMETLREKWNEGKIFIGMNKAKKPTINGKVSAL